MTPFVSHSSTAIFRDRSASEWQRHAGGAGGASLRGSFSRRDVSGECVLLIHAAAKHPAAELSAVFVPLNAGGNGASNLVSGLPVKL